MYPPLPPFLGVTKIVGEIEYSVENIEPENGISTGIMWKSYGTGLVPIFEEHSVRIEKNISVEAWLAMSGKERAFIIAAKRIQRSIDNQQVEAESRKAKQESAKGK